MSANAAFAPPQPASSGRRLRLMLLMLRDRVAVSLPLALMALLAGGTWWLVRNTPLTDSLPPSAVKREVVDYEMERFVTERFGPDGSLRASVQGRLLRHYSLSDVLAVEQMQAQGVDDFGRRFSVFALRGVSDAQGRNVQLSGQVRLVREPAAASIDAQGRRGVAPQGRVELMGEALTLDTQAQRARSDRPITVIGDLGEIRANSLDYNGASGRLVLDGRVRGVYMGSADQAP